jgi:ribosome-binding factor A
MSSDRMRRVNEAIRQVIGDAVSCDLKDPRVGFVTVTDVRTSADLSHARVYVSVLADWRSRGSTIGEPDARAETMDGLRSAHGYLQRRISGELHLKRTPTLEFSYDDTTDRAMRLDALIDAEVETRQVSDAQDDPHQPGDDQGEESMRT